MSGRFGARLGEKTLEFFQRGQAPEVVLLCGWLNPWWTVPGSWILSNGISVDFESEGVQGMAGEV
jgi:hypothetical protein